ncbi:MAG: 1-acyl-sn-glycerol-3-phosphate acyltransferase [Balneolaceae bacterium]|nr:1-acyl-sn-glycerol-3-phosphate acyltransferase [Balneolaceae bacterium]MBO6545209.1 1-acyl-sn-glycerol-3-phosphate acyltransferase [Balneolaceae bacterium]MBO6646605.1 1-acyl-sn-glycerol-3-phosphate acyltransferase [Balneolaceae bacterium]
MATSLSFIEYVRSVLAMLVFMVILLIASVLIIILLILTWGSTTNWIVKTFPRYMAYPVLFILGIKFNVIDKRENNTPPAIYIFNHSSTLDIPTFLALGLERFRVVAKWELQYIPFFFIIGRLTGQVFIKRKNSEKAIATLLKTYDRLKKHNLNLIIAPEGSRKHEGIIGPFKKGAFRMAIDLDYPIVPIYFDGNDKLSLGGSLFTKSGKIDAYIHPPIDTSNWKIDTIDTHIAEVRGMYLKWAGVEE